MPAVAWITGAGGLIGNYLVQTAPNLAPFWNIRAITRELIDLTDFRALKQLFRNESPSLIVHCAALSRSPECQIDPIHARRINVDVTACLAELSVEIPMIFLSSDLVFDGRRGDYVETDSVNPLSVYAETKADAEEIVLRNPRHTVLRTSLNGGASPKGNRGFNEELRRAWQDGKALTLFTDEFRSPIPAIVTAQAIWEFVRHHQPGLYHLAGAEKLSRWQIGKLIAARWPQLRPHIEPDSIASFKGMPRPPDSSLNSSKIQKLLSFPLPSLTGWLQEHPTEIF